MKELEEILLDNSRSKRTPKIDTLANLPVRQALTAILRENHDVFAWNPEKMPRTDLSIMVHRLNMSPSFPPIRQKKQIFATEQYRAIAEEV